MGQKRVNKDADALSKFSDPSDFVVSDSVFKLLDNRWGPHSFDRFADSQNRKCRKFNSLFLCPGSYGADCFNYSWTYDNNWLVPPFGKISQTIRWVIACRARATLVIPKWKGASYWPLLVTTSGDYRPFVKDFIEFNQPKKVFSSQDPTNFAHSLATSVLALRLDCTRS